MKEEQHAKDFDDLLNTMKDTSTSAEDSTVNRMVEIFNRLFFKYHG